jgi:hypothetical protein
MHLSYSYALLFALEIKSSFAISYKPYPPDAVDALAATGLAKLAAYQLTHQSNCTIQNAVKRREW